MAWMNGPRPGGHGRRTLPASTRPFSHGAVQGSASLGQLVGALEPLASMESSVVVGARARHINPSPEVTTQST